MHFDEFLRRACPPLDLEWRKYRRRAARHRVLARMAQLGLTDFQAYLRYLAENDEEAACLPDLMRITVTRFFREQALWQSLAGQVLPRFLAGRRSPLRAWSLGCAGGEEPYTLALLWIADLQPRFSHAVLEILATDIDWPSLDRARQAVYPPSALREVPAVLSERWFAQQGGRCRLRHLPAGLVRLRRHNFMDEPAPGLFDLVLARYLPFTYYRGERRRQAARRLWRALRPGGALMIGRKERLGTFERELFSPWPGAPGFFRRRRPG